MLNRFPNTLLIVFFGFFFQIRMTPPKLKRCEMNEEDNRETSALLRMFH